jgi:predicted O-methyltransferase YrrM
MESLNPLYEDYAQKHSSPEPELLRELNRETHEKASSPRMLSGHLQGRLLSMLSKMIAPKKVLDIGTYTGYSALCLVEGLSENGELHTIDKNEGLEEMARRYFERAGRSEQIHHHLGDALEILRRWSTSFDLVFIDADKENYVNYFDELIDRIPVGGYILADNVLWKGKVTEDPGEHHELTKAIHAYNEKVKADDRVEQVILPVRDGLSIARKVV